jgi:hypothetical protein
MAASLILPPAFDRIWSPNRLEAPSSPATPQVVILKKDVENGTAFLRTHAPSDSHKKCVRHWIRMSR